MMRHAVVIGKTGDNYSAYVPDPPGCTATGSGVEEVESEFREAVRFRLDGMAEVGVAPPQATTVAEPLEA